MFKILLLEDDLAHAEAILRSLEYSENVSEVVTARTLKEFQHQLHKCKPDLILSDLNLPDGKALDILSKVCDLNIPILIMTAYGDEETAVQAIKAGALDYIVKSESTFNEMPRIIERARREWDTKNRIELTESALRESESNYRTLFETMVQGGISQNAEGKIIEVNPAAEKILGYPLAFLKGKNLIDPEWNYIRENGEHFPSIELPPHLALRTGNQIKDITIGLIKENTVEPKWIIFNSTPLFKPGEMLPYQVFTTLEDITSRKIAQEEKEKLESQLNQSTKMESVGRLAGGVAHDFNNMLSVIIGYSEIIYYSLETNHPFRDNIIQIIEAGKKSRDLTRQLLAFARKQTLEMKIINLNEVVTSFEKMLRRTIKENVTIVRSFNIDPCIIKGDIGQLEQVILNLVVNAQDAMPQGGNLTLTTNKYYLDSGHLETIEKFNPGDYVHFQVKDSGIGIEKHIISKIFDPFFTTKDIGKGTGLGLSTVYGIVKQHEGFITVESELGKGTAFNLYFPASEETEDMVELTSPPDINFKGAGTILIVEDNEDVLKLTSKLLERMGYTTLPATGCYKALELLKNDQKKIDLLITDIVMPRMNGKELYDKMLVFKPDLKVIFMSGYTKDSLKQHGFWDADYPYLSKPFDTHQLAEKVKEVLNGGE